MRKYKKALIFVCLAFCYLSILPLFWPRPTATAELPHEHPYDEDLGIKVRVSAWHTNVQIRQVRFYVDSQQTTAHGPEGSFYAMNLFHIGEPPRRWPFLKLNRFSWPRSREMDLTLPLTQLAQKGMVGTGVVRGKVDITIVTPDMPCPLAMWLGYLTTERTQAIPLTLRLVDYSSPPLGQ